MSKLVKNIAGLCYEVNKLYYEEKDKKVKKEFKAKFEKLIKLLEKAIKSQFNENDKAYKDVMKDIKKINKKIKKLKTDLKKTEEIFVFLSDIIENIDTILTDVKVFK
jgi:seryl-tRNA synthetase